MKKKLLKITMIFLLILYLGIVNAFPTFATEEVATTTWDITNVSGLDTFPSGQTVTTSTQKIMGTIINTIKIVGTGISIIMLVYVAIKYMSAAPSEKAEFKKSATAYIVGAVVLFAASNILGVIADFATKNIK